MAAPTKQEDILKDLMKKKDEVEDQIKLWHEVLNSQKGVGMDGPLVDAEQFPRNDIDIPTVREARHKIICLQNDHKSLMKEIETELYKLHEQLRLQCEQQQPMDIDENQAAANQKPVLVPFARVDRVDAGSPSEKAGLQVADEIVQFGSISTSNFEKLNQIGELVQHSINKSVSILVLRNGERLRVSLKPATWAGRGLLGCIIFPIPK